MPKTPQTAAPKSSQNVTISLSDIAVRYFAALQHVFDIGAFLIEGTRNVSEKGYDDTCRSARFTPLQKVHSGFDKAKGESERWLLRNLLSESIGMMIPFLEDCRSICSIAELQASENMMEPGKVQKIVTQDRRTFLKLDFPGKLGHLDETFGVGSALAPNVIGLIRLGNCLAARRGVVGKEDLTNETALAFDLVALEAVPAPPDASGQISNRMLPKFKNIPKSFANGSTVELAHEDHLNAIATISAFVHTVLQSVQRHVEKLQKSKSA